LKLFAFGLDILIKKCNSFIFKVTNSVTFEKKEGKQVLVVMQPQW
jgi:hypothetical protein